MQFNFSKDTKESIKVLSISGIVIVTFFVMLSNLNIVGGAIAKSLRALAPFLFGIFFTFLLMPLRKIVEEKWLSNTKLSKKIKRRISVAVAMVTMIIVIIFFFYLLIPQLISSLTTFTSNLSYYITNIQKLVSNMSWANTNIIGDINNFIETTGSSLAKWLTGASGGLSKIVDYISSVITVIINFLIGMIIAMYLLIDTEKFKLQSRKLFYAVFPIHIADKAVHVTKLTTGMFYKFIFGKAVDSLIIGIICYVGCLILKIPYSILIAVVIGITNMIPVFGPFIGAIPCLIILVMIRWVSAFEFLIFIIILQQLDGNIIGPYILGGSTGLPTLWVMFAIIVGGALFGVVGMFIGVPAFAVIYVLVKDYVHEKLEEKEIEFPSIE